MAESQVDSIGIDWTDLPLDVLSLVFSFVVSEEEGQPVPLEEAKQRIATLVGVCSLWRRVFHQEPPLIDIDAPLCDVYIDKGNVISGFKVITKDKGCILTGLSLHPPFEAGDGPSTHPWTPEIQGIELQHRMDTIFKESTFSSRLRRLRIELPEEARNIECFQSGWVQDLHMLKQLSLSKFREYQLENLPDSIDTLNIEYGEIWVRDVLSSHSISILTLPPQLKELRQLTVRKTGVVGIVATQLLKTCQRVEIHAMYTLLGVTIYGTQQQQDARKQLLNDQLHQYPFVFLQIQDY